MPHYLSRYDLYELKVRGIKAFENNVEITTERTVTTGAVLKLIAYNGGVFTRVYLLDPVELTESNFSLTGTKKEALTYVPSWNGTLHYTGTFKPFPGPPPTPPEPDPEPPPPPPPAPTVLSIQPGSIEAWATNNLVMEVGGVPVISGQKITSDQVITLRTTGNYSIVFAKLGTYSFVISPDKKSGTLQLPGTVSFVSSAMEYVTELGDDIPVDVKGSNSVYKIADSDLETITTSRFQTVTSTGNLVDYGQFILGLIKIPFAVDPSLIVGSEEVRLGPVRTGVVGQVISRDRLVVPLGSISVPAVDMNSLDYQSTSCKLHLPYANPVSVDVQHVIGETIEIALSINLYDGEAQYTLKGSKFNQVFDTVTCYLDVAIPFANVVGGIPNKNNPSNVSVGVDNGIRTAFIEVERKPREMPKGFFTTAVNAEGVLLGQVGYFEVGNCELEVRATHEELERLRGVLRDGVIIK